jgi:DNA mismatch repair protein MutS2
MSSDTLLSKLDLKDFIQEYEQFLARPKPLYMEGDSNLHFKFIQKLSNIEFKAPPEVKDLDQQLMYLKKQGRLRIYEIYEFVKIVTYFNYLKKSVHEGIVGEWLDKIVIPDEIWEVCGYFDYEGMLRDEIDERFLNINSSLKRNKEQIKESMNRLLTTARLAPYLVDRQIHYIDESETLLVRGGFNHFLKGTVVGRSSGGYFYVAPEAISNLKKAQADMLSQREELIVEYEKRISALFHRFEPFLTYINKAFDRFDHYQARTFFARAKELEFVKPASDKKIKLTDFAHPALHDPKPTTIDFSKKILMITGVNAGGKTMLLKSILSAVFMAKYLLPMRIDPHKSHIGHFKEIAAIIDDPQSVKNDISTFAGRMLEFSRLFGINHFIAGVDEIELGTDSDEAASLFKVILEHLAKKDAKIIITTHHKRLAAMMATHPEVELAAAIYDEKHQKPTFDFLYGTIGKSYAFETALRYGISAALVAEAKKVYGEDKERLGELIQKNIDLELKTRAKLQELEEEIARTKKLNQQLENQKFQGEEALKKVKSELEREYADAIDEAKRAAKSQDSAQIHRMLNIAHQKRQKAMQKEAAKPHEREPLKVGDWVKYRNTKGKILSLKKEEAMVESEGMRLRVPIRELKRSGNPPKQKKRPTTKIDVQRPSQASVKLDLHGLRAEEAIEKLDAYLSDALVTGYDEVLIYHGVGTGKLAYAVKEFLKRHPKIKSFSDAPANMGGMGATVVRL